MCPQFGSAEVRIYPLLVIGGKFGNDIDSDSPMLRMYSAVLRLCASLDAMLQGLICMLDFVAIVFLFTLDYFVRFRSGVLRGNP